MATSTKKINPFTDYEIKAILEAFKQYAPHHLNFVEFKFRTGVRTGEAANLTWGCIPSDCQTVTINATKTGKTRTIKLSQAVTEMLLSMPRRANDKRVFTSQRGGVIYSHTFNQRFWVPMLQEAGVEYRRAYNTRHSFVSHALRQLSPADVASISGHSVKTMFNFYAGQVATAQVPTLDF